MSDQSLNAESGLDSFDHVVVLMLENRSFDNLLGKLYENGVPEGKSFEGLNDFHDKIPVPERADDFDKHPSVGVLDAEDYHQPFPDPGEVYQHVNTQLFNHIDSDNLNIPANEMRPPYNIPSPLPPKDKMMQGAINDYINTLLALKNPKFPQYNDAIFAHYSSIMKVYPAEKVNVLSSLAKNFAVFDHWHCSVPSQTWCNRAFWHAASSGGQVVNPLEDLGILGKLTGMKDWAKNVWTKDTLFDLMDDAGVSHAIYTANPVSLTAMVNGPSINKSVYLDSRKMRRFKRHVRKGKLPQYTFIEPKFIGQHNDQHPSSVSGLLDGPTRAGTVIMGEHLIWDIYTTLFTSKTYKDNTLLIITHDEHGGCFDHVTPPAAVSPDDNIPGQKDFNFDRLGVRVPMVMVGAHIQPQTIVNETFDHSSFIATMCKKWGMPHLTERDKAANTFEKVFGGPKRDFPPIDEPQVPKMKKKWFLRDELNDLQRSMVVGAAYMHHRQGLTAEVADQATEDLSAVQTVGDALSYLKKLT